MKKWELERKRKQHDQLVRRAKPTIRRDSGAGPKTSQIVVASKSSGKLGSTGRMGTGEFEDEVFETHTAPIFKLLKAFNLQQYSKKLADMGFETQIYKLVLLSEKEKLELVEQLRVLPGHKAKLLSLIDMIKEIYPRETVLETLAKASLCNNYPHKRPTPKSVKRSYNQIDRSTRQFFKQAAASASAQIVKEISLKTSRHSSSQVNNPRAATKPVIRGKRQKVKQKDIMAMIYPSSSYSESLNQAVQEIEHTLRPQEPRRAPRRPSGEYLALRKKKEELTVVSEKRKEEEEEVLAMLAPPKYAIIDLNSPTEPPESATTADMSPQPQPQPLPTQDVALKPEDLESEQEESKMEDRLDCQAGDQEDEPLETMMPPTTAESQGSELPKEKTESLQALNRKIGENRFGMSIGKGERVMEDLVRGDEMCKAFSMALLRHIEFSKGAFHIDELNMEVDEPEALEFSYNLGNSLLRLKREKGTEEAKASNVKNFEELERKLQGGVRTDTAEEVQEEIGDFLSDDNGGMHRQSLVEQDIDFDYTETQLEEFLQSQNIKDNQKVRTSSLISSFVKSMNRLSTLKPQPAPLDPIESNSEPSPEPRARRQPSRQETKRGSSLLMLNPVQTPGTETKDRLECEESPEVPEGGAETLEAEDAFTRDGVAGERDVEATDLVLEDSSLMESQYEVEKGTSVRAYLLETMKIFDENYCYEEGRMLGAYPPAFWGNPSEEEIFEYCHYILVVSKMETEIPILALAYVERLLVKTGVLLNFANWRKVVLATMILASKIWDDDSFENQHFAQVFPEFSLREINALERTLLELLDYALMVKGSEYARFFFLLRSLYDSRHKRQLPLPPRLQRIQPNEV